MSDAQTGQVAATAAEVYDEFFLPALFDQWATQVCDTAMLVEGQSVLDVACGTGVLACAARSRVGPSGAVTGVDVNDGMLAVAGRKDPSIVWKQGPAEDLPVSDGTFDAVLCQFGLMFFSDQVEALREMKRAARPGGQIVIAVWTGLDQVPGYTAMVELLDDLFGAEAAESLRAPYSLGGSDRLADMFAAAGLEAAITTRPGTARFPSIESWVHTEIRGWTLADSITDEDYDRLLAAALDRLTPFVQPNGSVALDHPAHIITAAA